MIQVNKTYEIKIYPRYGDSPQEAHTLGYFGAAMWANDVFRFLNQHCASSRPPAAFL